jgi:prolyl oligopeptidase
MKNKIIFTLSIIAISFNMQAQEDPYIWLEEVESEKSLEFVEKLNESTFAKLSSTDKYEEIYDKVLAINNATDRIEYPTIYGTYVYNFWKDKDHVRGIWRRSDKSSYLAGSPNWETLLDLDKLSADDDIKWVYKGASGLYPDYNRFLLRLSKGGADAVVIKEFDVNTKAFIEDGFYIPESKGGASYIDKNTLIVSTNFGENTMTTSGYPNQAKIWKRGDALENAQLIHTGDLNDVGSWGGTMRDGETTYTMISRATTFYTSETYIWVDNKPVKLDIPKDASASAILNNELIVDLKSDWTVSGKTYKQGSIISLNFKELLAGKKNIKLVVEPDQFSSISGMATTKNKLIINLLNDVKGELYIYSFTNGKWESKKVDAPKFGSISISGTDDTSDQYFFEFSNFLTPTTLYVADAQDGTFKPLKSLEAYFDASPYKVEQVKVKSKDGTLVPYFVVSAKSMKYDGTSPTLIYAYGGFEVSQDPFYSGTFGTAWLENGGTFVLANIRGGGEYGPKWHQAGLKEKRQNVYDDFHAVAEDLIAKKITSPEHLGIMGGSNGGLLVGVAFTQRPDLYNAVVCQVPLLDMKRYNKLLAGASWMGEYGNPDIPEEWAYIKEYSPYQNLKEGVEYPEVYFYTSTRDDRVHPGHARKMAAKMIDMGNPIYYYENTEGGHAGSSTNEQRAKSSAMTFSYLLMKLAD